MSNCYDFSTIPNYTIGSGAIKELRRLTRGWGSRYLILTDGRHADEQIIKHITDSLTHPVSAYVMASDNIVGRSAGLLNNLPQPDLDLLKLEFEFYDVPGKVCSYRNAKLVGQKIVDSKPDIVVAVGGSKCLDMVRAALHYGYIYNRPKLVMCPTILASNACANGMSIIYDESTNQMTDFWNLATPPEYVIIDTNLIINSPVNTLTAGIGDQLASSIEALHTLQRTGSMDSCDRLCIAHHQAVIDILMQYAVPAIEAMKQRKITPEFEWVCHCISRYTGPQLAVATSFFAHILDEALIEFPAVAQKMHGHVVGYGVLPEMVIFGTPEKIPEYVELYRRIGIPSDLTELGIPDCTYDKLLSACSVASDKIMASRAIVHWTPKEMADAVMEAERIVSSLRG